MILGVSFDTEAKNRAFAEKFGFNFPLLCDTDRAIGLAYGATDQDSTRGARRIGVVIDEQGVIQEYERKVNAADYPAQVLSRL